MSFENEDCVSSKHVMLFLISKDVEVCLFTGDIMVYTRFLSQKWPEHTAPIRYVRSRPSTCRGRGG